MSDAPAIATRYDAPIEAALTDIERFLRADYGISPRSIALLLLQGDSDIETRVRQHEATDFESIRRIVSDTQAAYSQPLRYVIPLGQREAAKRILSNVVTSHERHASGFAERLSRAMMHPVSGTIILLAVLYFGLYQFVGVLGAGKAVGFLEGTVFKTWFTPWITGLADQIIPFQTLRDLFVGKYGVITMGLSYAFAIILPIVGTFFIIFSIIEDSGYLPRLAMLIDRVFKGIGLSGRAVIPMVLGFGCDTMATIVTRIQETKRERLITTLLLALAIPCSAQLGVILAILSGNPLALLIWALVVLLVLLLVGFLAAKVIPGKAPSFYMEVPPLRLPKISNVLTKTYTRLVWYFTEVLPFFLLASVLLWLGNLTGAFNYIINGMAPLVTSIGLPRDVTVAFIFGWFRRDFGAAGLYDLHNAGILTGIPLLVAAVTLTLFIPCIAQFMVMAKERGLKTALGIAVFIFPFAFLMGFALNWILVNLRVTL